MRDLILLSCLLIVGCKPTVDLPLDSADTGSTGPEPGAVIYDIDTMHLVEVEIDADDWDELRWQQRNLLEMFTGDCLEEPFSSPYTYFHAEVTVDGERFDDVGIRKKGLIGSNDPSRPSLKIRFDEYRDGLLHDGVDRLTLNNGRQDPAVISQCLGYELFHDAQRPASRCSFARVVVNGEDLEVYSNVEAVEPPMLARWFDDGDGDLWEGQGSDFREDWLGTFEVQEGSGDDAPLQAVVDALDEPDDQVVASLEGLIHMDAWYRHWAMEVLLGHWDGYAGNTNNFFVYLDPDSQLLHFLPWGIDALFDSASPFGESAPSSVVANTALPQRLYQLDPEPYYGTLLGLLDEIWIEDDVMARVDAMEALVLPFADADGGAGVSEAVDDIRSYVSGRRGAIEAEIASGYPELGTELRSWPCLEDHGSLDVQFETTWGSYGSSDMYSTGSGSMGFELDEVDHEVEFLGAVAGEAHGQGILLVAGRVEWGSLLALWLTFPPDYVVAGNSWEVDWSSGEAYLYYDEGGTGEAWGVAAYLGNGPATFDQAGTDLGAALSGSVDLRLYLGG